MRVEKVLVSRSGRFFYVRDLSGDYHSQLGFVRNEDLRKAGDGDVVRTSTGKELFVLTPSFCDSYRKIRRGPQIIPLKDLAAVVSVTGINRESRVVEAGSGSGASACFLGKLVKEVYSYEVREDFAAMASENVRELGMDNVFVRSRDVYAGVDDRDIDAFILDLSEPWKAVGVAFGALKPGGFLVSYSPTVPQVSDFVAAVSKHGGFVYLRTIEIIERDWEVSDRKLRPKSAAIGHSGFISFARKVARQLQ